MVDIRRIWCPVDYLGVLVSLGHIHHKKEYVAIMAGKAFIGYIVLKLSDLNSSYKGQLTDVTVEFKV